MRWTERQRAMLREMGVHLWARDADAGEGEGAGVQSAVATPPPRGDRGPNEERAQAQARVAREPSPPVASRRPDVAPASRAIGSPVAVNALAPADWLVVGDAFDAGDPQQEQLLDNMLRAIGVTRSAPARAGRAAFFAVGDDAALAAAIAAVDPRCVVALGRAAATALLGSDAPLGSWRGRRHERDARPVVVTFALAFLLRHPAEKAKAWDDLCLAVRSLAPPAPTVPSA